MMSSLKHIAGWIDLMREKIIIDLEALDLLEKIDPHTLKVPRGDRSGVVIEPLLTDQWFVAVETL